MPSRDKAAPALRNAGEPAANLAEMTARSGAGTVVAAWPSGLARIGSMVTACERCGAAEVCNDWLARAPQTIDAVPPFCPNAGGIEAAAGKKRG